MHTGNWLQLTTLQNLPVLSQQAVWERGLERAWEQRGRRSDRPKGQESQLCPKGQGVAVRSAGEPGSGQVRMAATNHCLAVRELGRL